MDTRSLPGEYYLQGVREMASGFLLNPDGSFQFFFSYGALDRQGTGQWVEKDDQIIFNSAARPSHDFALLESKNVPGNFVTIKIKDNNPNLFRYVYGSLEGGVKDPWEPANKEGEIKFPKQEIKTISLLFEFCPERTSVFDIQDKTHDHFTFRFEPWIVEVFLENFTLQVQEDALSGSHPLLKEGEYRYAKQ